MGGKLGKTFVDISIHALRKESDWNPPYCGTYGFYFNPRSP